MIKKELRGNTYKMNDGQPETYKNVDLDYVYIMFEQEFHTWIEGEHVVTKVEQNRTIVQRIIQRITLIINDTWNLNF